MNVLHVHSDIFFKWQKPCSVASTTAYLRQIDMIHNKTLHWDFTRLRTVALNNMPTWHVPFKYYTTLGLLHQTAPSKVCRNSGLWFKGPILRPFSNLYFVISSEVALNN